MCIRFTTAVLMPEKLKSASSAELFSAEWKGYFFGSPVRASFSSSGPPGYGRPRAPGHLVEGLARSVVPGMAQKPEPVVIQHFYYMAVTA